MVGGGDAGGMKQTHRMRMTKDLKTDTKPRGRKGNYKPITVFKCLRYHKSQKRHQSNQCEGEVGNGEERRVCQRGFNKRRTRETSENVLRAEHVDVVT